jgi:uncharacterized protein (TIRG00374 family)
VTDRARDPVGAGAAPAADTRRARRGVWRGSSRALLLALGLAMTALFTYLALRDVKFSDTWSALRASNYWWTVPALAVMAVSVVMRAERWRILFKPGRRPPLVAMTKATLVGLFFNNILPLRAGEAARIVALRKYTGTSLAETTATVVVERVMDVLSLLVILFVALPWLPSVSWVRAAALLGLALAMVMAVAIVVITRYGKRPILFMLRPLAQLPFVDEKLVDHLGDNIHIGLESLRSARQGIGAFVWTIASWLVLGLSFWILMLGFDLDLSFLAGILVVVAVGLAFIIPAAPAAIGIFEAAGLAALSSYGISKSHALAYVLVLHAFNFVPYVLGGVALIGLDARFRRSYGRSPT